MSVSGRSGLRAVSRSTFSPSASDCWIYTVGDMKLTCVKRVVTYEFPYLLSDFLTHLPRNSLSLGNQCVRCLTTASYPLAFRATPTLSGAPMKKRKKVDVNIIVLKEAKRKRKLEKAIRRLETKGRKLKPIEEIEGDRSVLKTMAKRQREHEALSFEESESRALLHKEWGAYKNRVHREEIHQLGGALLAQQKALTALREESEELYQEAIQPDPSLIPHSWRGPVHTPPIPNYEASDGDYTDTTKKYDDKPIGIIRF